VVAQRRNDERLDLGGGNECGEHNRTAPERFYGFVGVTGPATDRFTIRGNHRKKPHCLAGVVGLEVRRETGKE
jgi:hypothetical protein